MSGCDREQAEEEQQRAAGVRPDETQENDAHNREEKGHGAESQVDDGSGRGRVALENTIVVGRVYIQRMERMGKDRRDAGRPPREPG